MAKNVTPRKGAKSAPSTAPAPRSTRIGPSAKSAPTAAPAVRSTIAPKANGDASTPTSVKSNVVEPVAPSAGTVDPNIGRTA